MREDTETLPTSLTVRLDAFAVGDLWGNSEQSHFRLHAGYLDHPARPVLGQWFEDRLSAKVRRTRRLHPWFENALPERGGAVRRRLIRSLGLSEDDDLALLAALGHDLPGNVCAVRSGEALPLTDAVVDELEREAPASLRASLGGIQLKFTLSGQPERLSVAVRDADDARWILKVAGPTYPDLAYNENAIMSWFRRCGFDVPETRVIPREQFPDLGDLPSQVKEGFLIRRYDRVGSRRIHQEDLAQVLGLRPASKYEGVDARGLARRMKLILGDDGLSEYWRRLVLVVASGNADAHLKNWSLIYPDAITPGWAPLYDQVATIQYDDLAPRLSLRMGNAQHFRQVEMSHFMWLADQVGDSGARVRSLVERTLLSLRDTFYPEEFGMPESLAERLRDHWSQVPLLRPIGIR